MICKDCPYREDRRVDDVEGFDLEARLRRHKIEIIDYCTKEDEPCDEAYKVCPYRDITLQAEDLTHIWHLLLSHKINSAIQEIKTILGE
jgi:hypothetical protein